MLMNFLMLALVMPVYCGSSGQYLVCKAVSDIFSKENETIAESTVVHSSGNRGPRGYPGKRGPRGFPGVTEYAAINNRLQDELQTLKDQLMCQGGVVVGDVCYKLAYYTGIGVNYGDASRLCSFRGGLLAEIPNEKVYNAVYSYVQHFWNTDLNSPTNTFTRIWLDSTYQNGQVTLRNGTRGYVRWDVNHPSDRAGYVKMGIHISIRPEDRVHGMFNEAHTFSAAIVPLCQFEL